MLYERYVLSHNVVEMVTMRVTWPNGIRGLSRVRVKNKYKLTGSECCLFSIFPSLDMSRPTRTHTNRLVSALSFSFFLFLALLLLCPPAVSASAEDKKAEYGTVIGIGTWSPSCFSLYATHTALRLGNDVRTSHHAVSMIPYQCPSI